MLWRMAAVLLIVVINPCKKIVAQGRDSIFLYNGQILIGEIKGGELGEITVDDLDLPDQDVKMYKIKRLNTARRFKIEMNSKTIYYGIIKPGDKNGWVNIVLDHGDTIHTEIVSINEIITLRKTFWQQLDGNFSAGFTYTKSSDLGQINASLGVQYASRLFLYQVSASAIESIDSNKLSRDQEDAGIFVAYNFRPAWFFAGALGYQRNLELSLASRFQQMIGFGNKVFLRRYWHLLAMSGITFNQEKSTAGTFSGLLLELPITLRYNFFRYRKPNIQINTTQSVFFGITQKGRKRYDGNLNFSWELVKNFYLTLSPYANYDNQPPEGDINFDYGLAFSLTFKF